MNRKAISLLLKISLSLLAILFVALKLRQERYNLSELFSLADASTAFGLFAALALLPLNLGIEASKWVLLVKPLYPDVKFRTGMKAVLAGFASGIFTPNRIGEYAGRVLCLPEGHRVGALVLTFFDRIGQMFITLVTGMIALLLLLGSNHEAFADQVFGNNAWMILFMFIVAAVTALVTLVLAAPEKTIGFFFRRIRKQWAGEVMNSLHLFDASLMRRVVVLSFLRYFVFSCQYFFLLCAFCYTGSEALAFGMISVVFLGKSLFPVLGIAELGVREWVAITVMGIFGVSTATAFNATFMLYLVNFLLPAAVGSVLLMGLKTENRRAP